MDFKCFYKPCTSKPKAYCECSSRLSFICQDHLINHLEEDNSKHTFQTIYRKIPVEEVEIKHKRFAELKVFIQTMSELVIPSLSNGSSGMSVSQLYFNDYFSSQLSEIDEIIQPIVENGHEIIVPGYSASEIDIEAYIEYLESIPNLIGISNGNSSNCIQDILGLKDFYIRATESVSEESIDISEHTSKSFISSKDSFVQSPRPTIDLMVRATRGSTDGIPDYASNGNYDEHLHFFRIFSKTMKKFDTLSLEFTDIKVDIAENQGWLACVCQIPGKKLFYYGGHHPCSGDTYLFDLENYKHLKLTKGKIRGMATATYYGGSVYVFGGYNGENDMRDADKFDMYSGVWESIANLPVATRDTHVLTCKGYFILVSRHNEILKYNVPMNLYESLSSEIKSSSFSVLFKDKGHYIYLSENNIYTSSENNIQEWKKQAKQLSIKCLQHTSKPVTRGKDIYFASSFHFKVYMFSLETYDLYEIASYT
ncbi:hypothetical protein SteCoe_22189 [Stentor coeruleus]|uniref:Uncharacterized protein n=1 Tax=Stentor coeruleus TaxID=5963 RepID=A0A1R2BMM9_9CILI|nr:hypothetical protein SteCoe_22189 [Stentor coeruleus]